MSGTNSEKEKSNWPEGNKIAIIDDAVGVGVSIAYKKVDDNVDEKSNLPGNVKDEELLL